MQSESYNVKLLKYQENKSNKENIGANMKKKKLQLYPLFRYTSSRRNCNCFRFEFLEGGARVFHRTAKVSRVHSREQAHRTRISFSFIPKRHRGTHIPRRRHRAPRRSRPSPSRSRQAREGEGKDSGRDSLGGRRRLLHTRWWTSGSGRRCKSPPRVPLPSRSHNRSRSIQCREPRHTSPVRTRAALLARQWRDKAWHKFLDM